MYCKESRRADQRMAVPVNGSELWRHVLFYVLNLRTNRTPGLVDYVVLHIEEDDHLGTVGRAVWPSLRCSETPMGFQRSFHGEDFPRNFPKLSLFHLKRYQKYLLQPLLVHLKRCQSFSNHVSKYCVRYFHTTSCASCTGVWIAN